MIYNVMLGNVPMEIYCKYPHPILDLYKTDQTPTATIVITTEDMNNFAKRLPRCTKEEVENAVILCAASDALSSFHGRLFHAAAIEWGRRAWLFAGPPSIGKSTQLMNWMTMFPDEVHIINGDKPILSFDNAGNVVVTSSPWTGKEGLGVKDASAPLGGIILLEKSADNEIRRIDPWESIIPVFKQFFTMQYTVETVGNILTFENDMLSRIPVFLLKNDGTEVSTRITYNFLRICGRRTPSALALGGKPALIHRMFTY